MKRRNIKHALVCCAVACAFTACTDVWEEHYQPNPDLNAAEDLWTIIKADDELRNFAALRNVFREMMELTDPESREHAKARRRLIYIEQLLRKKAR